MRTTPLVSGIMLVMLAAVEAGPQPGGNGGTTQGGNSGPVGPSGPGGLAGPGGASNGGNSMASGNGGSGGNGGIAKSGAGGFGGSGGSPNSGGDTLIFEGDTFGANTAIGGDSRQFKGGSGAGGGNSGMAQGGAAGAGGNGPTSGNGGMSGPGGSSIGGSSFGGKNTGGSTGPGGNGGNGGTQTVSPTYSPQLSAPISGKRSVRDLFERHFLNARAFDGYLARRGGGTAQVNELNQITEAEFVNMVDNKQKGPGALETALGSSALLKQYTPPANRAPCSPQLCSHSATHAISFLTSNQIPASIMAAIQNPKNGWTKVGSSAPGGNASNSPASKAVANGGGARGGGAAYPSANMAVADGGAASGGAASNPTINKAAANGGTASKPPVKAAAPVGNGGGAVLPPAAKAAVSAGGRKHTRDLYAREAYPEAYAYDSELFARDAYDSAEDLYARDAYDSAEDLYARDAYPEVFYDYAELFARDAEAEADYDYAELYARYAEADPEAYFDYNDAEVYARDTEPENETHGLPPHARARNYSDEEEGSGNVEVVGHVSGNEIKSLIRMLQVSPKAQKAVLQAVNSNPVLAHYAQLLEKEF